MAPTEGHQAEPRGQEVVEVPGSGRITVVAKEFKFIPHALRVEQGQHVTIVFRNEGSLSHNLTIPNLGLHTDTQQRGATETLEFTAPKAGVYQFWCTVPGHKEVGMTGRLTVAR